jgi:hypothetical protein
MSAFVDQSTFVEREKLRAAFSLLEAARTLIGLPRHNNRQRKNTPYDVGI